LGDWAIGRLGDWAIACHPERSDGPAAGVILSAAKDPLFRRLLQILSDVVGSCRSSSSSKAFKNDKIRQDSPGSVTASDKTQ
jgi:hypothetical protein